MDVFILQLYNIGLLNQEIQLLFRSSSDKYHAIDPDEIDYTGYNYL